MYLKVFLTNLGKYNEGELEGKWVDVDGSTDWDEELKSIGVSDEPDADGNLYEEYFISDYESDCGIKVDEYESLNKLDEIGELLSNISSADEEKIKAIMEAESEDLEEVIQYLDNYEWIPEAKNDEELGKAIVDEIYGKISELSREQLERYFDYEAFGRDIRISGDGDNLARENAENAIEDEEFETEEEKEERVEELVAKDPLVNNSDENIASYYINDMLGSISELGQDTLETYFDYEAFGRDVRIEEAGSYTKNGYVGNLY